MNQIVFCKDNYKSDMSQMWGDISKMMQILTMNGYVIKFYCDEPGLGIYCLEYESEPEFSGKELVWKEY